MTRRLWIAVVAVGVISLAFDMALSPSRPSAEQLAPREAPPARRLDSTLRVSQLEELHPMTGAEKTSGIVTVVLMVALAAFAASQGLGWRAALVPCLATLVMVVPAFVMSASSTPSAWPLMAFGYGLLAFAAVIPGIAGVTLHRIWRRFA
jgi:hypothetical protein